MSCNQYFRKKKLFSQRIGKTVLLYFLALSAKSELQAIMNDYCKNLRHNGNIGCRKVGYARFYNNKWSCFENINVSI